MTKQASQQWRTGSKDRSRRDYRHAHHLLASFADSATTNGKRKRYAIRQCTVRTFTSYTYSYTYRPVNVQRAAVSLWTTA